MFNIPIHYVSSPEEAKKIREEYKNYGIKVHIFISGQDDLKSNLKDFLKARNI